MTAKPSVIELRMRERWWVRVDEDAPAHRPAWRWTKVRDRATVFATRTEAERFRIDECLRFLSGHERRSTHVRDAEAQT